ncbi:MULTISPECIES: Crp/Fnr family transcriptional regulator [unclassified Synechocystis]|uniref:Crp/Fnr family transcriptional regulator n=1 Tax=unclassified Synechocystis TaxID=2640012 RepID=UPI00041AF9A6|nr:MULTISPECIES: Crp/Fnr family transcriptional regulator [unclassified Synechocystis]AIE74769.1 cAMP-binding protein - catabolite gene activator and regulatory subunit of cAMP-dependent protein kinase [Synechocystis sp. PCC 6714]MCT0253497.1 Crp/Fnr family transcriptional regulator [Synechocystis sp. CS-94]
MNQNRPLKLNQLLGLLPVESYERLAPHLQKVSYKSGTVLYEPNEVMDFAYFPNTAMISVVSIMEDGSTTEIGLIGNEGMVGLPIILGGKQNISRVIVQVSGETWKLSAEILLREFQQSPPTQRILLLYTQARLTQVSQSAACNRQHKIEERLARWLMSVHDCVQADEIPLTQEFVANMLGVRRSGVTIAANSLQQSGMITYRRGKITLLDYDALKQTSCECYKLVQDEYIRLLGFRRG